MTECSDPRTRRPTDEDRTAVPSRIPKPRRMLAGWPIRIRSLEMLVGEPPFTGGTPQAVPGRIITAAVPSAASERSSVPANVDAVIARALEKVPADRFGSAADVRAALVDPGFRHGSPRGATGPRERSWRRVAFWTGGVATMLAAALLMVLTRPWAPPPPVEHFGLAIAPETRAVSVLPDGSGVVFARDDQLLVRRWENRAPTAIVAGTGARGTAGLWTPGGDFTSSVSPAGDAVAFVSDDGLMVAPLAGGTARRVAEDAFCCPHWAGDGFLYFSIGFRSIWRVPAEGACRCVRHLEVG